VNIHTVLRKLWQLGLLAFAFILMPTALMAQETLPGFSGNYSNWSDPFSLFIPLEKNGSLGSWADVCCMQLGRCRPCKDKRIPVDIKGFDVVRLQGSKNELLICQDPETERLFQCSAVVYEKGTLKGLP
jgi:hypothetical protein